MVRRRLAPGLQIASTMPQAQTAMIITQQRISIGVDGPVWWTQATTFMASPT